MQQLEITLKYDGGLADDNRLNFYDVSHALIGFQRTLALTAHLVVNGEIITQAPSLRNATIEVAAPEPGSWKITALVGLGSILLTGGVASRDSVLGHLFTSAYDYVLSESMGLHVDFDKSLGELIQESRGPFQVEELDQGKFDAVIEKVEKAVTDIHRPISHSESAATATIGSSVGGRIIQPLGPELDSETYEYLNTEVLDDRKHQYVGKVSSYNTNTYKGRVYVSGEGRPVPMTLAESIQSRRYVRKVVQSLASNAMDRFDPDADISFDAYEYHSKSGRLKRYYIVDIE